jgi:hypothetical protein
MCNTLFQIGTRILQQYAFVKNNGKITRVVFKSALTIRDLGGRGRSRSYMIDLDKLSVGIGTEAAAASPRAEG